MSGNVQRPAMERHYRVRELAALWGLSTNTITRLFADESGVLCLGNEGTGKRKYVTLAIPESVVSRVHERFRNQLLQPSLTRTNPLGVIRLILMRIQRNISDPVEAR